MWKKYLVGLYLLVNIVLVLRGFAQQSSDNLISNERIEAAEKLIGLNFSEIERDSMLDGLKEQLENYDNIREFYLGNNIPVPFLFNPIPLCFKHEKQQALFMTSDHSGSKIPQNMDDLAFYSIGDLSNLLKNQKITSLELTQFYIERLKKYGPVLECVITLTESLAVAQAKQADLEIAAGKYRGSLHGIPFGIKDLFATKGYKTTWGAMPFKDQFINDDATVVTRLQQAGAVLVAKLTMGALAWGDRWYGGKTRNPWKVDEGSSGSSAGSAAAVSAGLVPFAIGTETWGSIVSPCTVCGVTGLRPTFGRVSRYGAMALSWSMDKIGPICRNVEDCAIVLNSLYGPDGLDQSVIDFPFNFDPDIQIKDLQIGYLKNDFSSDYPFRENDSLALETMRNLGAQLIPIELPDFPVEDLSIILSVEAAAAFDDLTRNNKDDLLVRQIQDAWPNRFRQSRFIPAVEYVNANRIRYVLIQEMEKIMQGIDIYLAPSWQGANLLLTNLTGHPCVVVPTGFMDEKPTSITFNGQLYNEGVLLALAKKYQDVTFFYKVFPDMEKAVQLKSVSQ